MKINQFSIKNKGQWEKLTAYLKSLDATLVSNARDGCIDYHLNGGGLIIAKYNPQQDDSIIKEVATIDVAEEINKGLETILK